MSFSRGSSLALGLLALALAAGTASAQRHGGGGGGGGRDNDRPGFNSSVYNGGRARIAPRNSGIGVGYTRPIVTRDRGPVYRPPVYCPPSRPRYYGGGSYGGGGISIGGSYRDDNFGISIGINTPLRRDCGPAYCPPVRVPCEPVVYVPTYRPRYVETYVVT